jgi:aminoglycoside 2'-N-acetyltransferase I
VPSVRIFTTDEASPDLLARIHALMLEAFGGDFAEEDWEHALGGVHVAVLDEEVVLAHAGVVSRSLEVAGRPFRTGYLEAVATTPSNQGAGLGSLAVGEASAVVRRGFEMGGLSTGSPAFFARLGWERWSGPTLVRRGGELVRTPEEDAGVMVLRFGASGSVDLSAPISCEARRGDDW